VRRNESTPFDLGCRRRTGSPVTTAANDMRIIGRTVNSDCVLEDRQVIEMFALGRGGRGIIDHGARFKRAIAWIKLHLELLTVLSLPTQRFTFAQINRLMLLYHARLRIDDDDAIAIVSDSWSAQKAATRTANHG
jgi:hypothetical protein